MGIQKCNRLLGMMVLTLSVNLSALSQDPWTLPAWSARIHLTNFNLATGGSLGNFPVLVRLSNVPALATARADGGDLTFVDPNGAQLFHEIESFNRATGDLLAWVCIPTLTNQTRFYLYFSNANASLTFNGSNTYSSLGTSLPSLATNLISTNVWDPNFRLVLHFNETSGAPMDSSRYGLTPASVGTSNRPGTNGAIGRALATSLPIKNNSSNVTPVFYSTNGFGASPLQISYSLWAMFNSPSPAYVGSNQFMQLLSYFGGGSSTGVLCLRFDSNNSATHTTFNAAASTSKVTNFDQWNFFAGGGTLINYVVGSPTNGTNFYVTNGFLAKANTTAQVMISNNSPGSGLSLGGYPNVNYHPSGGFDEFRLSHTNREAIWLITEYSNAMQPANQVLADGPEYATTPVLLTPAAATATNMSIIFSWSPGYFSATLSSYQLIIRSNNLPWLSTNTGSATNLLLPVSSIFGMVSTNTLTWWVEPTLSTAMTYSSATNTFVAALAARVRVQGLVCGPNGLSITNVLVQLSGEPGAYQWTDAGGAFDFGALIVNRPQTVILTPPGFYGLPPFYSNFTIGTQDLVLGIQLTNAAQVVPQVTYRPSAPIFIGGSSEALQLRIPLNWTESRRVQVSAIPLSGGRKSFLYDGTVTPDQNVVTIEKTTIANFLTPGPHILEYRLTAPGMDEASALVARQLFFYAR